MYTPEQLTEIEQFASRAFTVEEIAIIMCVDEETFASHFFEDGHPVNKAYMRGSLRAQLLIRNSMYDSAISGSSPAQAEIAKLFAKQIADLKNLTANA